MHPGEELEIAGATDKLFLCQYHQWTAVLKPRSTAVSEPRSTGWSDWEWEL